MGALRWFVSAATPPAITAARGGTSHAAFGWTGAVALISESAVVVAIETGTGARIGTEIGTTIDRAMRTGLGTETEMQTGTRTGTETEIEITGMAVSALATLKCR
jgi:hypothetical protein